MAMGTGGKSRGTLAEINVTPLVDVMLVLLIIFMITAPMLQHELDVNLPVATGIPQVSAEDQMILTVNKQGRRRVLWPARRPGKRAGGGDTICPSPGSPVPSGSLGMADAAGTPIAPAIAAPLRAEAIVLASKPLLRRSGRSLN